MLRNIGEKKSNNNNETTENQQSKPYSTVREHYTKHSTAIDKKNGWNSIKSNEIELANGKRHVNKI